MGKLTEFLSGLHLGFLNLINKLQLLANCLPRILLVDSGIRKTESNYVYTIQEQLSIVPISLVLEKEKRTSKVQCSASRSPILPWNLQRTLRLPRNPFFWLSMLKYMKSLRARLEKAAAPVLGGKIKLGAFRTSCRPQHKSRARMLFEKALLQ